MCDIIKKAVNINTNEIVAIQLTLKKIQKRLFGFNYETHFWFELIEQTNNIENSYNELCKKYSFDRKKLDIENKVEFKNFKNIVSECINYNVDNESVLKLTNSEKTELKDFQNKLWNLMEQKILGRHFEIYILPEMYVGIFWSFNFLILNRESNRLYMFQGISSD